MATTENWNDKSGQKLMQPNDFPDLENNPLFRYEEGVLEGLLTARMALKQELVTLKVFPGDDHEM